MAKAGPQLASTHPDLSVEQEHLDGTVRSMLDRIRQLEDRERNAGADLETSLVMADNAEEQAAMLSVHVHQPYFGSLSVRIGGQARVLYVGKYAHGDFGGPHSVIDWRTQVGSLFYTHETEWETRPSRPGGRKLKGSVERKRQLDVQQKKVLGITDLYENGERTGGREAVLVARLSEQATSGMRDVVQTLQPEQDEAMRTPVPGHLLVQGAAGSGKTTIGFHRLSWLMNPEQKEPLNPGRALVLMPNPVLARYAAKVLPSLQLDGVHITTPEQWAVSYLGIEKIEVTDRSLALLLTDTNAERRKSIWRKAKLLGSLRMLEVIKRHVQQQILSNITKAPLNVVLTPRTGDKGTAFSLSPDELQARAKAVFGTDPLIGYRAAIRGDLIREGLYRSAAATEAEERRVTAQIEQALLDWQSRVFSSFTPVVTVRRLLANPEQLKAAGQGLLSAQHLKILASDPLSAAPAPKRSHADVTELPLMLAVRAYLDGLGIRDGQQLLPYDHVLLDEAQDYAPVLYALLARAARPGQVTALGDLTQGLHGYKGVDTWEEAQEALGGGILKTLSRTYRSTAQISRVTGFIAQNYSRQPPSGHVERQGREVEAIRASKGQEALMVAQAIKNAQARGHQHIAVVTRRRTDAESLAHALATHDVHARAIIHDTDRYEGGVVVVAVQYAKGLEFDVCIMAGATARNYDPRPEYDRRLVYVAASRGLHELTLISEGDLHPLLAEAINQQGSPDVSEQLDQTQS